MAPNKTNNDSVCLDTRQDNDPSRIDRAALVIHALRPGGGERVVVHLAERLAARGVRTMVMCMGSEGPLAELLAPAGVPVAAMNSTKGYDLGAIRRMARCLREFAPSVINCHDRSSLPYVVLANWLSGRRPVVYSAHGLLFNAENEPRLRHRLAMRGVSATTAVSEEVARRHASYLAWKKPFAIIPNGVPNIARTDELRQAVRKELDIDASAFVFLAVGNAKPEKGFEDLLDAVANMPRPADGKNIEVLVAGTMTDSPYCLDLLARQKQLGLDKTVRFLGYRADMRALYSAADAFVLSSRSEGLPMVLLEAMTSGLAVVATRVGGVPDATPREAGILVDPANPRELARAMASLANDPEAAKRMSTDARRHATEHFGVETMVSSYLDVYSHAARGGRRPSAGDAR